MNEKLKNTNGFISSTKKYQTGTRNKPLKKKKIQNLIFKAIISPGPIEGLHLLKQEEGSFFNCAGGGYSLLLGMELKREGGRVPKLSVCKLFLAS